MQIKSIIYALCFSHLYVHIYNNIVLSSARLYIMLFLLYIRAVNITYYIIICYTQYTSSFKPYCWVEYIIYYNNVNSNEPKKKKDIFKSSSFLFQRFSLYCYYYYTHVLLFYRPSVDAKEKFYLCSITECYT